MKRVSCKAGVERLMEYLEGALPAGVRASLEAHVAACRRCQSFVASYQATPRIVRAVTEYALPSHRERELRALFRSNSPRHAR